MKKRCWWPGNDPLYIAYHDREWGVPLHDDQLLFEFLTLEGVQAGLSWITVLKKRDNYRRAMNEFDYEKIARYPKRKIDSLMRDQGLIRNRLKMESAVRNARAFIKVRGEFGSFDDYIWGFVDGSPIVNRWKRSQVPGNDAARHDDLKRSEETRLQLRRADHLLRLHASDRDGQRPHDRLLSAQGMPSYSTMTW